MYTVLDTRATLGRQKRVWSTPSGHVRAVWVPTRRTKNRLSKFLDNAVQSLMSNAKATHPTNSYIYRENGARLHAKDEGNIHYEHVHLWTEWLQGSTIKTKATHAIQPANSPRPPPPLLNKDAVNPSGGSPNTSRRVALGANNGCPVGKIPEVLRPGIAGMRGSMVLTP